MTVLAIPPHPHRKVLLGRLGTWKLLRQRVHTFFFLFFFLSFSSYMMNTVQIVKTFNSCNYQEGRVNFCCSHTMDKVGLNICNHSCSYLFIKEIQRIIYRERGLKTPSCVSTGSSKAWPQFSGTPYSTICGQWLEVPVLWGLVHLCPGRISVGPFDQVLSSLCSLNIPPGSHI